MFSPAQVAFRKIVLHNKLVGEAQLDALLERHDNPEHVIRALVTDGTLKSKIGVQLLELYQKQLARLPPDTQVDGGGERDEYGLAPAVEIASRPPPTTDDDILAMLLDEPKVVSKVAGGSGLGLAKPPAGGSGIGQSKPAVAGSGTAAPSKPSTAAKPSPPAAPAQSAPPPPASPAPAAKAAPPSAPPDKPAAAAVSSAKPAAAVQVAVPPSAPGDKKLILSILKKARELGASDVHLTAGLRPAMRLASQLKEMDFPRISPEEVQRTLLGLLTEERKRRFLEHWDLDFCYDDAELGRFRANYLVEQNGMAGVFRLIPSKVPSFEQLKLPELVRKFTEYRVGIVLVTGPKSCGKTSTLAAMVDHVNTTRREHIITVEDPIEFVHPCKKGHISQREVGAHTQTFSNALRAALREAPDVIMVGEMRDLETTSLAITAAETGHLVLATLHTPDAIRTISSVLDVFPPKEQGQIRSMLSESLRGIVSQQLIPNKNGQGMELALEILVNKSSIANLIREDRTFQLRGLMQTGKREGMILLDDSLLGLVNSGKIAPEEALARASDETYVQKELDKAAAKKGLAAD